MNVNLWSLSSWNEKKLKFLFEKSKTYGIRGAYIPSYGFPSFEEARCLSIIVSSFLYSTFTRQKYIIRMEQKQSPGSTLTDSQNPINTNPVVIADPNPQRSQVENATHIHARTRTHTHKYTHTHRSHHDSITPTHTHSCTHTRAHACTHARTQIQHNTKNSPEMIVY